MKNLILNRPCLNSISKLRDLSLTSIELAYIETSHKLQRLEIEYAGKIF